MSVAVDQLKDLDVQKLHAAHEAGTRWYLCKRNEVEGVVLHHKQGETQPSDIADGSEHRELELFPRTGAQLDDFAV